jgi:elongation factor G
MSTLGEAAVQSDVRNVAVLGHKGSGKTALIEAALFLAKASPGLGRPGERAAGLDDSSEERAHRTTLEVRAALLQWNGAKVNLLDTPGEASFACDAKLALAACDGAVVCVSARDGVQTGTERALAWVRERHVPCLVMLTKMDDEHARPDEVVAEIKKHVEAPLTLMEVPEGVGRSFHGVIAVRTGKAWEKPEAPASVAPVPIPPESRPRVEAARAHLVDDVAGTDDALTEKYLNEGDLSQRELDEGARHAVLGRKLIPIYEGSSTMPNGIAALLDGVVDLLPSPADRPAAHDGGSGETREPRADAPLSVLVFKTRIDPHAGKVSYVRVLSGTLRPDASLVVGATGQKERAGSITAASRDGRLMTEAVAGDICVIPKLKAARTGDTLAEEKRPFQAALPPMPPALYARSLIVQGKGAEDKAAQALQRLCEEDPGLVFKHDPQSREMLLEGLGALHLDIALERLRRRASIDCRLGPPHVAYRETVRARAKGVEGKIKKQTGGHGQFGVCYVDLEPLPRGSGFVFEDAVVGGVVPRQFIPSVEKGARRALERGVLAGYPVVDVKVRLLDGKYHSVDSSDAAFQAAGGRAVRAALAAAQPALLEPIARLQVRVPADYLGDVIGDLNARGGRVTGSDAAEGAIRVVDALVPLANTHDYEPKLTSLTSGRGTFALAFDHYDYCSPHTTDRIVKQSGFKPIEDED